MQMSTNNPNLIERLLKIENKIEELERRILNIENLLGRFPPRPSPQPGPVPPPRRPGPPPPEPFKF